MRFSTILVLGLSPSVAKRRTGPSVVGEIGLEKVGGGANDGWQADRGSWPRLRRPWEPPSSVRRPLGPLGLVVDQGSTPVRDELVGRTVDEEQRRCFGEVVVTGRKTLRCARHDNGRLHSGVIAARVGHQTKCGDRSVGVTGGADLSLGSTRPERVPVGLKRVMEHAADHKNSYLWVGSPHHQRRGHPQHCRWKVEREARPRRTLLEAHVSQHVDVALRRATKAVAKHDQREWSRTLVRNWPWSRCCHQADRMPGRECVVTRVRSGRCGLPPQAGGGALRIHISGGHRAHRVFGSHGRGCLPLLRCFPTTLGKRSTRIALPRAETISIRSCDSASRIQWIVEVPGLCHRLGFVSQGCARRSWRQSAHWVDIAIDT